MKTDGFDSLHDGLSGRFEAAYFVPATHGERALGLASVSRRAFGQSAGPSCWTVCLNRNSNLVKLLGREAVILSQRNRRDPEFADHSFPLHVRRFVAVEAAKLVP